MSDFAAGASVGFGIRDRILAKKMKELDDQRYNENRDYRRGRDKVDDDRYAADKTYRGMRDTAGDSRWDKDFGHRVKTDEEIAADRRESRMQRGREFAQSIISKDMEIIMGARKRRLEEQRLAAEIQRLKQPNTMASGYEQSTTYDEDGNPTIRRVPFQPGATQAPTGAPTPAPSAMNPQDQQAIAWAKANPNDPRAARIVQRLAPR